MQASSAKFFVETIAFDELSRPERIGKKSTLFFDAETLTDRENLANLGRCLALLKAIQERQADIAQSGSIPLRQTGFLAHLPHGIPQLANRGDTDFPGHDRLRKR
jgi:orotate phosphoribosyltransferase